MKSSLSCTTAAALRGFAGWFSGKSSSIQSVEDHVPYAVSACGYRAPESARRDDEQGGSWLPGLSLDNFS